MPHCAPLSYPVLLYRRIKRLHSLNYLPDGKARCRISSMFCSQVLKNEKQATLYARKLYDP